jgi:glucose dehydrogenase
MPSYRGRLAAQEVADVVAYLLFSPGPTLMKRAVRNLADLNVGLYIVAVLAAAASVGAQSRAVTSDRILKAAAEPQNWLTYSGNYNGQRYSTLDQVTPANVKNLELQWVFQVRTLGAADKFEATPLVVDGIMYTVSPPNDVVALDAVSGRVFWRYDYANAPAARRVLRSREPRPRHPRRSAVHGHDRRQSHRAECENRCR